MIEHLVGMQAQWPAAPYVGIWTRTTSFAPEQLERELVSGVVIKATVMRQTLHLVTPRDYGLIRSAMSENNFPWETPIAKRLGQHVRALAAAGPLTSADALAHLATHDVGDLSPERAWRWARQAAHVIHHHETALWKGRPAGRYVALDEPDRHDPTEARAEMVRRYLAAFGPASVPDLHQWSMQGAPQLRRALATLDLVTYRSERGKELFDLAGLPLADPETPAPVRFLPKWDNLLLAFADRTRILPEPYRKIVIAKNGDVAQTFLVDGLVAGTWRVEKGRVVTEPLARLSREAKAEVAAEAARVEEFLSD